jgi:hypothetical protein
MIVGTPSTVNTFDYDEDNDMEVYVNTVKDSTLDGWKTLDDSWIELEDEGKEGSIY